MDLEIRCPEAVDAEFARAWTARMARSPHANFGFSLDYLAHEARAGTPLRLVLADDGAFRGALVLRDDEHGCVCGQPWRAQALVEGADRARPEGMTCCDALRLFDVAARVAGSRRLRFHSPVPCGGAIACHPAGSTVLVDLARSEDELFARLDRCKRACIRKALREGFEISDQVDPERLRAFAMIENEIHVRRHGRSAAPPGETPSPGEGWRGWERPWHSILFALERGRVVAGYGWGRSPGGMVDGRADACTEDALRRGANVLLVWEVLRRARAAGHTWANLGGATRFKREFGGTVVTFHCRLGGGIGWLAPNLVENLVRGEGRRVARALLEHTVAQWPAQHAERMRH